MWLRLAAWKLWASLTLSPVYWPVLYVPFSHWTLVTALGSFLPDLFSCSLHAWFSLAMEHATFTILRVAFHGFCISQPS